MKNNYLVNVVFICLMGLSWQSQASFLDKSEYELLIRADAVFETQLTSF